MAVVAVEATTGRTTCRAPRMAASSLPSPASRRRSTFSSTTIPLSTTSPNPHASPARVSTLREKPPRKSPLMATSTLNAIVPNTVSTAPSERRNSMRTRKITAAAASARSRRSESCA